MARYTDTTNRLHTSVPMSHIQDVDMSEAPPASKLDPASTPFVVGTAPQVTMGEPSNLSPTAAPFVMPPSTNPQVTMGEPSNLNPTAAPFVMPPGTNPAWDKMLRILEDGPSNPSEWWAYEVMSTVFGKPEALSLTFDVPALWLAFSMLQTSFPTRSTLFTDIFSVVTMLPIKKGDKISKKVLMDLILCAAKELRMHWWMGFRERMLVFVGIVLAGMILRRVGKEVPPDDAELGELMGNFGLGVVDNADIMERLAVVLDGGLKIGL